MLGMQLSKAATASLRAHICQSPPNKLLLLDDILASVKSLLADQKRITPDQLASIVPIAENTSTGLVVRFVMVPPAQADITKSEGMTIDEAAFRDVEKRLVVCAKIAANSIDEGNAFALTAEEVALHAEDVSKAFDKCANEKIARAVANRSRFAPTQFELLNDEKQLGGNHNVPVQFTSKKNLTLNRCRIVCWPSSDQVVITSPTLTDDSPFAKHIKQGSLRVGVEEDSKESFLIECARLSGISVDIQLNLVEKLSPKRTKLKVVLVDEERHILEAARSRIDARLSILQTREAPALARAPD